MAGHGFVVEWEAGELTPAQRRARKMLQSRTFYWREDSMSSDASKEAADNGKVTPIRDWVGGRKAYVVHYPMPFLLSREWQRLNIRQRAVFQALYMYADGKSHECFPGYETIMEQSTFSRSRVAETLKELERMGYIKRSRRMGKKGRVTNLYKLLIFPMDWMQSGENSENSGMSQNETNLAQKEEETQAITEDSSKSQNDTNLEGVSPNLRHRLVSERDIGMSQDDTGTSSSLLSSTSKREHQPGEEEEEVFNPIDKQKDKDQDQDQDSPSRSGRKLDFPPLPDESFPEYVRRKRAWEAKHGEIVTDFGDI